MSANLFSTPAEVQQQYPEMARVFASAFPEAPWYEVSACADLQTPQRCPDGLSRLAIGEVCSVCTRTPDKPAHEPDEVIAYFDYLGAAHDAVWYTERVDSRLALAGVACLKTVDTVAMTGYKNSPEMQAWLRRTLGEGSVVWLQEVFADKTVRPHGNLRNFRDMCQGMTQRLDSDRLAFCTINPHMVTAARNNFGEAADVYRGNIDIADRYDLVVIHRQ